MGIPVGWEYPVAETIGQAGGCLMKRKLWKSGGQLPAAGAFLLLSLALMWGAVSAAPSAADAVILPDLTEELSVPDAPEPPAGALAEGERLAGEELRYVQRDFPELGCTEVRLREVRKVCACDHVKGERFEIYKADFLYDGPSGWEELDRGPGRYLIFRETDGGSEWLGISRSTATRRRTALRTGCTSA